MNCPLDGTALAITHRDGIEIDYCPKCRGIWLDRGELEKLIARAAERDERDEIEDRARYASSDPALKRKHDDDYREYDDDRYEDRRYQPYGKRRKSFLSEVFDIFD